MMNFQVSAPGKVILNGEHSVVYGKTALAASLNLRTQLDFRSLEKHEGQLRITLPDIDLTYSADITSLNHTLESKPIILKDSMEYSSFNWKQTDIVDIDRSILCLKKNLIKNQSWNPGQESALIVFHFLLYGMLSGIEVTLKPCEFLIKSQLSIGAGLGSSASYSVCIAGGIYQYVKSCVVQDGRVGLNIARCGYQSFKITSSDLSEFDLTERQLIECWAKLSDGIMHGTASGVDTATISSGGVVEFRRSVTGQPHFAPVPHTSLLKIVLVNTCISRNTKQMVGRVKDLKERLPKVVNCLLEAMDEVSLAALELLAQTDSMDRLGELVEVNHCLLQALGVSHPALDEICNIAKDHGLHGKLTGAGGGGYAFILLPPLIPSNKVSDLLAELVKKGFEPVVTNLGGPGLVVGPSTES